MPDNKKVKRYRRFIVYGLAFLFLLFLGLFIGADRYVEPILKQRLHTFIIQGSDSLYTYSLGNLKASVFRGSITLEDLQVAVNTKEFRSLQELNELPPLTMELQMGRGEIRGLGIIDLLFRKKIDIGEINTKNANVRLFRHLVKIRASKSSKQPLWKSIQPSIKSISVRAVNLDGIKLLYRNADSGTAVKLQFDTCFATFQNMRIDSAASEDPRRVGFSKDVFFRFSDLKFRSPDSMSKMKAETITYSSKTRNVEIVKFKLQPTREEKEDFYGFVKGQQAMNVYTFEKATISNFGLDQFLNANSITADSVLIFQPEVAIYMDKTYPPIFKNKIGTYPHQKLLGAETNINVRGIRVEDARISYTEKAAKSKREGRLDLSDVDMQISNATNDPAAIAQNNRCTAKVRGNILGRSPIAVGFAFYLDDSTGKFEAAGAIKEVSAQALNRLAIPLANVEFESFNLKQLDFNISGSDYQAEGSVDMIYDRLFLTVLKPEEAGTKNKFLTKVVNKYTLHSSNPAPGEQRRSANVVHLRITSQAFFGVIWKTIFSGMQRIMLRQGQVE